MLKRRKNILKLRLRILIYYLDQYETARSEMEKFFCARHIRDAEKQVERAEEAVHQLQEEPITWAEIVREMVAA